MHPVADKSVPSRVGQYMKRFRDKVPIAICNELVSPCDACLLLGESWRKSALKDIVIYDYRLTGVRTDPPSHVRF